MEKRPVFAMCEHSKIMLIIKVITLIPLIVFALMLAATKIRGLTTYWFMDYLFPVMAILPVWGIIVVFYGSPTLLLHSDGVTVKFLFRQKFVKWDDVLYIRKGMLSTTIFFQKLTIFNSLIGLMSLRPYPAIVIGNHRKNYSLLLKLAQENIPDRLYR